MAHRFLHFLLCSFFSAAIAIITVFFPCQTFAGKKPLFFIENKGQVTDQNGRARSDIDFKLAALNGLNLFIGNGQLHYQWIKARPHSAQAATTGHKSLPLSAHDLYRMDVQLIGANPDAVLNAELPKAYYDRYYLPSIGSGGAIAHTFQKITYRNVYPHIDWVFYFNSDGKLEHDFIVHPGGKPSDIKLQYSGAAALHLDADGSLLAITPLGSIHEHVPYAYTAKNKRPVKSSFILQGNILSFSTAPSDETIVIDPVLEWGTYFGGNDVDYISDVVTGNSGRIYTTGATNSASNIATTGAYQATYGGGDAYFGNDAFISKFDPAGNCIWSTYYGTGYEDVAKSITKDTSGKLYIAGYTFSTTGLSTNGAFQLASGGSYDAFIASFDTSGSRIWGTYFGGTGEDGWGPVAIHCDKGNNLYLTGQTNSATGIATAGAYQTALFAGAGDQDAFLAKFNTAGALQWGTYFGGNYGDAAYAVATDANDNILIAGNTNSSIGIASTGQTTNGGGYDAFIAKFNAGGSKTWSTYLGGNADDYGFGIACDSLSNSYITGATLSTSGLSTPGSHQANYGGGNQDVVIAKLDPSGNLVWSTYYGGSSEDGGDKIICANGGIYISGWTGSDTGMVTAGVPQMTLGGSYDGLIARFNHSGQLQWGSYIGGVDAEEAYAVAADTSGNLYIGGNTMSATGIATTGAWQPANGGGDYDGFLIRLKDCSPPAAPANIIGMQNICAGSTNIYIAGLAADATSYNWILPSGWAGSGTMDSIAVTFNNNSGLLKVIAVNDCASSDTVSLQITVNALPPAPQIVQNGNMLSLTQSYAAYQWLSNGHPITGATAATYTPSTTGNYAVIVFNAAGCSDTSLVFGYATAVKDILTGNGIMVFPNPTAGLIYIKATQRVIASLYSVEGKLLQTRSFISGTNGWSLEGFTDGAYHIRFADEKGRLLGTLQLIKSPL
jgi:hypothetical protein